MQKTFQFLKALETKIPPPAGQHHFLRFGEVGNDYIGWRDVLVVTITRHNGSQNYTLDESDWDQDLPWTKALREIKAQEQSAREGAVHVL